MCIRDSIYTSLDSKDILDLLGNISNYRIVDEGGFPEETMRDTGNIGAKGSCVIPVNLESNVVWLHQFLFDDANYSVTSNVKEYSNKIESDTSPYMNKMCIRDRINSTTYPGEFHSQHVKCS